MPKQSCRLHEHESVPGSVPEKYCVVPEQFWREKHAGSTPGLVADQADQPLPSQPRVR